MAQVQFNRSLQSRPALSGSNELEKHQLFRGAERASVAFEGLADAVLCICMHSICISTAAERRETSSTVLA